MPINRAMVRHTQYIRRVGVNVREKGYEITHY